MLEYSMSIKLLTERHLEFLSFKGSSTGSSESTPIKIPHCRKSHVTAHILLSEHQRYGSVCTFAICSLCSIIPKLAPCKTIALCMLGNFPCLCCHLLTFFKINFSKSYFRNTIRVGPARLIEISVNRSINKRKTIIDMKIQKSVTFNVCSVYLFN